ncbi:MAG: hypothetical protein H5T74_04395 [Actinobacteria bacterium]|nr:hypothetical protein [Actinomycetota bacterium]
MRGFWKHLAASASITAVFLACALAVSLMPAATPAVVAAKEPGAASFARSFAAMARAVGNAQPQPVQEEGATAPRAAAAARPDPAKAAPGGGRDAATPTALPVEPAPAAPAEPSLPDVLPDVPVVSAINPDLPGPSGLEGTYIASPGNPRILLSWTGASAPGFSTYEVERWNGGDFSAMAEIYAHLSEMDPEAAPYAKDFSSQVDLLSLQGLTQTEREDALAAMRKDVDVLNGIIALNREATDLWEKLLSLADGFQTRRTSYTDRKLGTDAYYLYVVVALYNAGETSPPSNSVAMFTYVYSYQPPAVPTGFIATAYDPGVALEWGRNTESDLAGYDVYLLNGSTPVRLNAELITRGTEFFYLDGVEGESYQVVAVNITGQRSSPASASAVLAPAVIYDADSPAWRYPAGTWAREDYSRLEPGGRVLRVSSGRGSRASLTFTGRRVRVYSARYWSCGTVNFYIDGRLAGSFDLYYDGGYLPDEQSPYKPALWQQGVFQVTGLSKGTHTLVVEATGIPGAEGLDFVNFDYVEIR